MADFDDKLHSLLSNPDAMAQIMQLAQSLSGPSPQETPPGRQGPPPQQGEEAPREAEAEKDSPTAPAGGLDPALLGHLLPLLRELGGERDSNARQLLYALRPYLRQERQEKVERALQLARLFHLGKKFLSEWEG